MTLKSNEVKLGEAIREMVEHYKLSKKLYQARIIGAWEPTVGTMIARHTTNLYIRRRKLYVVIDSPAIKNELTYSRSKLVEMLNNEAGENVIDEIVFL